MRILRLTLVLCATALMLTGCVVPAGTFSTTIPVGQQPTQSSTPSVPVVSAPAAPVPSSAAPSTQPAPPVSTGPNIPDGYTDAGNGVAYRWAEHGTELVDCSYYDSCVGVIVYAYDGCPSGGYIEANALDANGTIVTFANDLIPTMYPGNEYFSLLGTIGYGSALSYRLTTIDCY